MSRAALYAINAYAKVGVETGVTGASPHQLILMLYEGALVAIANARTHMLRGETAAKGIAISKAISIINDGLKASLDVKAGGPLARNCHALYEYMCNRLLFANIRNEPAALDEVKHLLSELKGAWEAIGKTPAPAAPALKPAATTMNRIPVAK
ncbi:MAG: flagellar export chaperone FliS [Burkholderiales bacterium]